MSKKTQSAKPGESTTPTDQETTFTFKDMVNMAESSENLEEFVNKLRAHRGDG